MPTEFRAEITKDPNLFGFFHGKYRTVKKAGQVFVEWYDKKGERLTVEWDSNMKSLLSVLKDKSKEGTYLSRAELLLACYKQNKLQDPAFSKYLNQARKRGLVIRRKRVKRGDKRKRIYELTEIGKEFATIMLGKRYAPTIWAEQKLEELNKRLEKMKEGNLFFDYDGKVWLLTSQGEDSAIGNLTEAEEYVRQLEIKVKRR